MGFKERRGPNEFSCSYPVDSAQTGVYFNLPRLTRNFFTTGVLLIHPAFGLEGVNCEVIASLLHESLLMHIPFDRQDIDFAVDRLRAERASLESGTRFVTIFDQTYGSLRLSGRLLEPAVFSQVAERAVSLASQPQLDLSKQTVAALAELVQSSLEEGIAVAFGDAISSSPLPRSIIQVIAPGSKGLNTLHGNEEFEVESVFFSPAVGGPAYRGRNISTWREAQADIVPVEALMEIPGESKFATYNVDTGEIDSSSLAPG